jgi:hypothetical protein
MWRRAKLQQIKLRYSTGRTTTNSAESPRNEFHIEEYKSLRQEILLLKQPQFTIEKWVVVSLGLIYGLAFGVMNDSAQKILPAKPVLFFGASAVALVGSGFYSVNDYILLHISEYIKQIENRFPQRKRRQDGSIFSALTISDTLGVSKRARFGGQCYFLPPTRISLRLCGLRLLKPRDPTWAAQQVFDHSRRNA